jgi:hypothetical protein
VTSVNPAARSSRPVPNGVTKRVSGKDLKWQVEDQVEIRSNRRDATRD